MPTAIRGDITRLRQVLTNLVGNGVACIVISLSEGELDKQALHETMAHPIEIGEAIDAAVEMIERMEKHLRLILEEPENTMSNGKAMREMLRQARLALGESK